MPYSNVLTNRFGVLAFEICQAVTPDLVIFNCYCDKYQKEFFDRINESIKYKVGWNIDCFNISNVLIDWINSKEINKIKYISLDSGYVDKNIGHYKTFGYSFFNVLNKDDAHNMAKDIIKSLTEYGENVCI